MDKTNQFRDTYLAFVDTLVDIYASIQELNEWKAQVHQMTSSDFEAIAKDWTDQLGQFQELIDRKDPSLFLQTIPCLVKIYVPQLWVQGKFTDNSKDYVWLYLKTLSGSVNRDIRPPLAGLGELYRQMPSSMIDKVKNVADKYSSRVERGEAKLEDLKFNEISQELFQNINAEEMQQVVQSVGGLLQNLMGSGAGQESSDFSKFLSKA